MTGFSVLVDKAGDIVSIGRNVDVVAAALAVFRV